MNKFLKKEKDIITYTIDKLHLSKCFEYPNISIKIKTYLVWNNRDFINICIDGIFYYKV